MKEVILIVKRKMNSVQAIITKQSCGLMRPVFQELLIRLDKYRYHNMVFQLPRDKTSHGVPHMYKHERKWQKITFKKFPTVKYRCQYMSFKMSD